MDRFNLGTMDDKLAIAPRERRSEDLTGRIFGHLTVLGRAEIKGGRSCWRCRCDCGKEKIVMARNLKTGKTKSCGCHAHDYNRNRMDITGQRFGRLTAICQTERRGRNGSVIWKCRCDCGNEREASEDALVQGNIQSCGCLKIENQKKIPERLHRIDGTCVEILERRKYRRDNTSGFRGVFKTQNGRYRVSIGFKGKRLYLGTYHTFEEAVAVRKQGEHIIYDGFLDAYHTWDERSRQDVKWSISHPLVFDADVIGGQIYITTNQNDREG